MPTYWFDVFTVETWKEASTINFSVSGFSESKWGTVKRVKPGDVLICYLKGTKRLIGALLVAGEAHLSDSPQIWRSKPFPARLPVEPIVILDEEQSVDFIALLPKMSFYDPENLRRTFAKLQGSPTQLSQEDGQKLFDAVQEAADLVEKMPEPIGPTISIAGADESLAETSKPVLTVVNPLEALIHELEEAQRDVAKPARFEQAVANSLETLGLDVEWKGQAGTTDVIIDSRLGLERYRAIVDAKASSAGKVAESQINWAAVADHRQKARADHAMVVGERFAGGNLLKFAAEYSVALLEVSSLIEVLRLHSRTPFTAADLRPLFATPGIAPSVIADLHQKSLTTERHWQLVSEIIRLVDGFSRSDPPVTPTFGHLHGALVGALLVGRDIDGVKHPLPSEQDIRDAVGFLPSRTVGVLRPVEPADTAGYRLALSPRAALQRLQALQDTVRRSSALDTSDDREHLFSSND